MAYTLGNKCAKNLSKQTVLLQLIIKNVVTCFFGTHCSLRCTSNSMSCHKFHSKMHCHNYYCCKRQIDEKRLLTVGHQSFSSNRPTLAVGLGYTADLFPEILMLIYK